MSKGMLLHDTECKFEIDRVSSCLEKNVINFTFTEAYKSVEILVMKFQNYWSSWIFIEFSH